jgi:hypothetical protein
MKNTVSFETASRLKAAGFPQPEPEAGQVWHEGNMPYVIGAFKDGKLSGAYFYGGVFFEVEQDAMEKDIFAPTATDILPQLPSAANISKPFNAELWLCVYGENEDNWTESNNPAEAAALAWFEIHEKKAFTPNVRITFEQNQTIECYDFEGNQRLLEIQKDKQYDAVLNDGWATIESVFGPVKFRLKEVVLFEWLSNKLNEQI